MGIPAHHGVKGPMRLTLHTDYALRTLLYLAVHTNRRVSIKEIARVYGISENHLVKIIHHLGRGGFIDTLRGRGGGLMLGRAPQDIRIGDVVRHTEDDMALVSCMPSSPGVPGSTDCLLSRACHLRGALGEALDAFMAVLDSRTLADMLHTPERQILQDAEADLSTPTPP